MKKAGARQLHKNHEEIKQEIPANAVIITAKGLGKKFGRKEVLKGINLEIKKGEIFGIIGMSGSGKTVLLKTLINFFKPDSGKIGRAHV